MQSPSYHSSSYLPKLEANFMRDFSCCGKTLPTLHDLLQHYEESHAQQTPQSLRPASQAARARETTTPNSKAAIAAQAATAVQHQTQQAANAQNAQQSRTPLKLTSTGVGGIQLMRQQQQQQQHQHQHQHQHSAIQPSQPNTPIQKQLPHHVSVTSDEMDGVEDMEMDDAIGPMPSVTDTAATQAATPGTQAPGQTVSPSMFGQPQRPTLNLNAVGMHAGMRSSQPSTPASAGFGYAHNPTVSSVNTPTLSTHPHSQSHPFPPDASIPGTPAEEMDDSHRGFAGLQAHGMPQQNMHAAMAASNFPFGYGANDLGLDLCIDEPAKRLFSPNGGFGNAKALQQQFAQFGLTNQVNGGQFGANEEMMRAWRQQQMLGAGMAAGLGASGANGVPGIIMQEEHKPFRCPVIGCEKAYKNQNGLKYVQHLLQATLLPC